jgi:5-methylcytosine-specific restriction endonuclease McrA
VRERAAGRCEYCRLPETESLYPFEAEHIIAEQHEGPTTLDNLAWACIHCNRPKGPNLTTFDPQTGEITRL